MGFVCESWPVTLKDVERDLTRKSFTETEDKNSENRHCSDIQGKQYR